jgi:hypothetical protein
MVGRACYGKPWLIAQIDAELRGDKAIKVPSLAEQKQIILKHFAEMIEHYSEQGGIPLARKHIGWYSSGLKSSAEFRAKINITQGYENVRNLIAQFYDEKINAQSYDLKENCDYFIYDAPGGWWSDQIKGMVFAYQLDVPTVNGYSGAFPPDYPVQEWLHEGDISGVFDWINKVDKNVRGCFTTGDLPIFYLDSQDSRFEFEDGFTPEETNGKSKWRWANRNRSFEFLYSPKDVKFRLNYQRYFISYS